MIHSRSTLLKPSLFLALFAAIGCSSEDPTDTVSTGGSPAAVGSSASGGANSTGGASASASGATAGIESTGGASTGGLSSGGTASTGGSSSGGTAGSASGGSAQAEAATFADVSSLLGEACATVECHQGKEEPVMADDAGLYDRLMTTKTTRCGDAPLIDPGNPDNSAIIMAIRRQCTDPEDATWGMPDGCIEPDGEPCIPQKYVDLISSWILAGAPQ